MSDTAGRWQSPGRWLVRTLLFGHWTPLLRDPLDVMRLSFLVAAVGYALVGEWEYAVRFTGTFLLVFMAANLRVPRTFDLLFMTGMMLQVWGNALRLFEDIDWWDNLVHLFVPFSSVPVIYVLLLRTGVVADIAVEHYPLHRFGLVWFAASVGLSIATLYEIYEFLAVKWLGANLAIGYTDTINDLILGVFGAQAGGLLLMVWAYNHWGTERRPGT